MTTADVLTDFESLSDFTWLVQRVCRNGQPWVVVSHAAVVRWGDRDPDGWSKVVHWLHEQGITLVEC